MIKVNFDIFKKNEKKIIDKLNMNLIKFYIN